MTPGGLLAEARLARGASLEQAAAATRIRLRVLAALEADRLAELPAPVYVRGYLRTLASYYEVDPDRLIEAHDALVGRPAGSLAMRPLSSFTASPNMVLTTPFAGAIGLLFLVVAFTGYVYRELESVRTPPPQPRVAATALPSTSPSPGATLVATPPPSPAPATASVTITATDVVWIDVQVDGKPQYADSGKVLQPGDAVSFSGLRVKVTTGKGLATLVAVNGRNLGPMGGGVTTREYTAQA